MTCDRSGGSPRWMIEIFQKFVGRGWGLQMEDVTEFIKFVGSFGFFFSHEHELDYCVQINNVSIRSDSLAIEFRSKLEEYFEESRFICKLMLDFLKK